MNAINTGLTGAVSEVWGAHAHPQAVDQSKEIFGTQSVLIREVSLILR